VKLPAATSEATTAASVGVLLRRAPNKYRPRGGGRFLPYPLLLLRKDILFAALVQFSHSNQIEGSAQLEMKPSERRIVSGVAKVSDGVERLFDT
jgi:hypothetical protein